MPQTIYDAMKLSRNPYTAMLMKAIATSDEMFSMLPMVQKPGEGFSYSREVSLGSFPFVADGHTSVAESSGTSETITVPKREAVSDFYVRNFAQSNLNDGVSPMELQTLTKFKAAGRTLAESCIGGGFITGFTLANNFVHSTTPGAYVDAVTATSGFMDSNRQGPGSFKYTNTGTFLQFRAPGDRTYGAAVACASDGSYTLYSDNPSKWVTVTLDVSDVDTDCEVNVVFTSSTYEFDGLTKLVSSTQTRSSTGANGDALSFTIMDELMDSVKVRDNLAFVGNAAVVRKAKALLRGAGGLDPVQLMDGTFTVPSYSGIPILKNDWVPSAEAKGSATTLSSLYLVSLSAEEGFWLGCNGDTFTVDSDPRDATVMGFRMFELGQNQAGSSSVGRRLSWFGGAALGSDLAAARASEIVTL